MRHTLFTTVAITALVISASAGIAQTSQSPGASGSAPGQLRSPATSAESPGRSESAPGQNRPSASTDAPGQSETAPGQNRGSTASSGASEAQPSQAQRQSPPSSGSGSSSAESPSAQGQRPSTAGAASESQGQGSTQSSDRQQRPQEGSSQSATGSQSGSGSQTATEGQRGQNQRGSQAASGDQRDNQQRSSGTQQQGSTAQQDRSTTQQGSTGTQSSTNRQSGTAESSSGTSSSASATRSSSSSAVANLNTEQRSEVTRAFTSTNVNTISNVNFNVSVGTTITEDVRLSPVPEEVVRIVPQYRGYQYVVVRDEIVIVEPRTKRIVEVISKSGSPRRSTASINLSQEQRKKLRTSVETTGSTRSSSTRIELREGVTLPQDLELVEVPQTIITEVPELRTYRYVVIGDELALVEPETRRVIEVVE